MTEVHRGSGRRDAAGRLPDFVVVGCMKGGTTSLDHYLANHPQIAMARPKEPGFFVDSGGGSRWERGEAWYRSHFRTDRLLCGETTPAYSQWPSIPNVLERMSGLIPDARLIYLVREPWARVHSHFEMVVRDGLTTEPFAAMIRHPSKMVDATCYGSQLQRMLEFYPRERILVLESAELARHTERTVATVCAFLGVEARIPAKILRQRYHVGAVQGYPNRISGRLMGSKSIRWLKAHLPPRLFSLVRVCVLHAFPGQPPSLELPADQAQALAERFRDEVALLRALTGQPLPSLDRGPISVPG